MTSSDTKARRWVSVLILCYINIVNYMDRYTVAGVLSRIAEKWELGDDDKGLIQTSFIICYFASAPVFGFLGDRYSRKWLMAFGVFAWGACTFISSFMPTFIGFLLFRAAIGFGEAGFTSIAPTVLGDLFEDGSRTIVLALFYFAIPLGSGLGYVVGTGVTEAVSSIQGEESQDDWRWGVRVTPMLNLLALILLMFFMLDPPRGEHEQRKSADKKSNGLGDEMASWRDDLLYLLRNKSYMLSTVAFTCLTFCTGALSWFGVLFVERALKVRKEHHLAGSDSDIREEDVSFLFGAILSAAGIFGLLLGSGLSLWLRKKIAWIDPVICGGGLLISTPLIFGALYIVDQSVIGAFVLIFVGQVFLNMNWAVVVDISLYVVIPVRRSSAEAFQLMASHALGEAGSPYLTGLISDQFNASYTETTHSSYNSSQIMSADEKNFLSLEKALYFSLGFELLGAVFFLLTALYVVSDKAKADEVTRLEAEKLRQTSRKASSLDPAAASSTLQ